MAWTPLPGDDAPAPRSLADGLDGVLRRLGAPAVGGMDRIFDQWDDVAGPAISSAATPVSLRDGVLVLSVDDPGWATQLRYLQTELLARLTEVAAEADVRAIEVRVRGASSASPRTGR
jgi:predicted nucleic acid-binding Zn ribbon protein